MSALFSWWAEKQLVCPGRAGQEEYYEQHGAQRCEGGDGSASPACGERLFYGDGGDVEAVRERNEGGVGDPEHQPCRRRVAQGAEYRAELAPRRRPVEYGENERREPRDEQWSKHERHCEARERRVQEAVVELKPPGDPQEFVQDKVQVQNGRGKEGWPQQAALRIEPPEKATRREPDPAHDVSEALRRAVALRHALARTPTQHPALLRSLLVFAHDLADAGLEGQVVGILGGEPNVYAARLHEDDTAAGEASEQGDVSRLDARFQDAHDEVLDLEITGADGDLGVPGLGAHGLDRYVSPDRFDADGAPDVLHGDIPALGPHRHVVVYPRDLHVTRL